MKKLRLLLMIALASLFVGVNAQNEQHKWAIGGYLTRDIYAGDLGDTFFNFDDDRSNFGVGLSINRYLNRFFDVSIYGSWGSHFGADRYGEDMIPTVSQWMSSEGKNYVDPDGEREFEATNFEVSNLFNANAQLHFKFLGKDDAIFVPYIVLGVGAVAYDDLRTRMTVDLENLPADFPEYAYLSNDWMKYHQTEWSDEHGMMYPTDESEKDNPAFAITAGTGAGVDVRLSRKLSLRYQFDVMWTDHDNRDFVLSGRDNDDAFNNDWQFKHNLGLVWSFGSSDTTEVAAPPVITEYIKCDGDGDGVTDDIDECPNTPVCARPVNAVGCPSDEDADGVFDGCDKCPGTPAGVRVDTNGCPIDTDFDGVYDYEDKCITERGPRSNEGCPVAAKALQPYVVHFANDMYNLDAEDIAILDEAVAMMKANPEVRVDIKGHTDSNASEAYNRTLSNSRANVVRQYIERQGIEAARINSVEGFWFSTPVGDNNTAEGRAQNRRTEVLPITVQ
jgi:outer membrane protein OmpA-like peptidoglycan-associated protein